MQEEEFEFEQLPDWLKNGWSTLLNIAKKVVQFLKVEGLWDQLVTLLKDTGFVAAKELCPKVLDEELCNELVGSLVKTAENGEVVLKGLFSWVGRVFRGVRDFFRRHQKIIRIITAIGKPLIKRWLRF